jgi:hypothetical protein
VAWKPSTFNHQTTKFALSGAHTTAPCLSCHEGNRFAGTPVDCLSCHRADEPANHFGPDCAGCHNSVAWKPSTFDHERSFPLLRGEHRDYRTDCAACHLTPGNYQTFTCTDCHDGTHSQAKMDREHRGEVRDYRYETAACFKCHPQGSKEEGGGDD